MQFRSQLFTFTNCVFVTYVLLTNLCVFDILSAIRHERELRLVLRATDAFCVHALDVCAQKTVYQKFK